MNTAIPYRSRGSQAIGFATPVSLTRQVFDRIIQSGRVDRGEIMDHAATAVELDHGI